MSTKWAEIKRLVQSTKQENSERVSSLTIVMKGDVETLREVMDFIDAKVATLCNDEDIDYRDDD